MFSPLRRRETSLILISGVFCRWLKNAYRFGWLTVAVFFDVRLFAENRFAGIATGVFTVITRHVHVREACVKWM